MTTSLGWNWLWLIEQGRQSSPQRVESQSQKGFRNQHCCTTFLRVARAFAGRTRLTSRGERIVHAHTE